MNRIFKLALVLLVLAFGGQLQAQFTTTFAKNVTPGQQNGLYYSLPQTMLKLDFIIEEVQLEKGTLSDYASNYFEMEDIVDYATTEYQLLDAIADFWQVGFWREGVSRDRGPLWAARANQVPGRLEWSLPGC